MTPDEYLKHGLPWEMEEEMEGIWTIRDAGGDVLHSSGNKLFIEAVVRAGNSFEAMRAALTRLQWGYAGEEDYCPACGAARSAAHRPECYLLAALKLANGEANGAAQ